MAIYNLLSTDIEDFDDSDEPHHGVGLELESAEHGVLSTITSSVDPSQRERAGIRRDEIANEMWDKYQQSQQSGGVD